MLIDSKLDIRYWGEAILCAIYIKNRSPTNAILLTPHEYWFGTKPNISHLRVFGSIAYVLIPKEKRTKFDPRSVPCIFIGYSERSKAYRLADLNNIGKVILSRDVEFLEGGRISDVDVRSYDPIVYESEPFVPLIDIPNVANPIIENHIDEPALGVMQSEDESSISSQDSEVEVFQNVENEVSERRYPLRARKPKVDPEMHYYAHYCSIMQDPHQCLRLCLGLTLMSGRRPWSLNLNHSMTITPGCWLTNLPTLRLLVQNGCSKSKQELMEIQGTKPV